MYNIYRIPTGKGKTRLIAEPDEEIRAASERKLEELQSYLVRSGYYNKPELRVSYAYTPGRSAKTLVDDIYNFVGDSQEFDIFHIDIKDFFGSITQAAIDDAATYASLLDHPYSGFWSGTIDGTRRPSIWKLVHPTQKPFKEGIGIAQGNPLSPLVANIVATELIDKPFIEGFGPSEIWAYFRYSDNIYLIWNKELARKRGVRDGRSAYFSLFKSEWFPETRGEDFLFGFTMKVRGNHQKNIILGMRLGATRAQLKDKKWLRSLFHRIGTIGPDILKHKDIQDRFGKNISYDKFIEKVKGLVAYILEVDPGLEGYILEHAGREIYSGEIQEFEDA